MRDYALLLILLALSTAAWWRSWVGVLVLAVLGFFHPQGYAVGFMREFPIYQVMFFVVLASLAKEIAVGYRPRVYFDWRFVALALLWVWFVVTTANSINPWAAWPKLWAVAKILPPVALVALLIDSRQKLFYLLFTIALSIALVTVKGGYWAVMTGFHDRVYGPPGSQYADNNEFAVAMVMSIPLLILVWRETRSWGLKLAVMATLALTYAAIISTWSRGGLLGLIAVTALVAVQSRRSLAIVACMLVVAAIVAASLPDAWFARMETILAFQGEGSAQSRLGAWRLGLELVKDRPIFGGGFQGWIYATLPLGGSLDWHSAYIEILTEHGLIGGALWGLLLAGTTASLLRLGTSRRLSAERWIPNYAAAIRTSLLGFLVGATFLGIAYWELIYWLVAASAVLSHLGMRTSKPAGVVV